MTFARTAACLVASAAVLVACSKPPASAAPSPPLARPAAASSAAPAPAQTPAGLPDTDMPSMKPGQWKIHMARVGGEEPARAGDVEQCLNEADMASAKVTAVNYVKANCSSNQITRLGDTWTDVLVCKTGGSTTTTRTVTAIRGDGGYHTDLTTALRPAHERQVRLQHDGGRNLDRPLQGLAAPQRLANTSAAASVVRACFRCGMSSILPSSPTVPAPGAAAKASITRRACASSSTDG